MKVGELNGKWAFLFKICLVLMPVFVSAGIGWAVWATKQLHMHDIALAKVESFMNQGPRFTAVDAAALELKILANVGKINEERYLQILNRFDILTESINQLKVEMARFNMHLQEEMMAP